jgi:hypothetical protein
LRISNFCQYYRYRYWRLSNQVNLTTNYCKIISVHRDMSLLIDWVDSHFMHPSASPARPATCTSQPTPRNPQPVSACFWAEGAEKRTLSIGNRSTDICFFIRCWTFACSMLDVHLLKQTRNPQPATFNPQLTTRNSYPVHFTIK